MAGYTRPGKHTNPEVRVGKREENPVMFMDISIGGAAAGRITIELRADLCPMTCENFRRLCTGEKGCVREGRDLTPLCYKNTKIHRVVKDSHCQGGDIKTATGFGLCGFDGDSSRDGFLVRSWIDASMLPRRAPSKRSSTDGRASTRAEEKLAGPRRAPRKR